MITDSLYKLLYRLIKSRPYSAFQMLLHGDLEYRIYRDMQFLLSTAALHKETFPQFRNINAGKDVVIVACGPSVQNYIPIKDAIHIGVNKALLAKHIKFDYWFCEDFFGATKEYKEFVRNYRPNECKKFFGLSNIEDKRCCAMSYDPPGMDVFLTKNSFRYRHEFNSGIRGGESELTYDLATLPFSCLGTVTFSAIQFALWTNPKRLFLVGCDCTNDGHFYLKENKYNLNLSKVLSGYSKFKSFSEKFYPDTKVISVNPVGLKGMFKDWNQKDGPLS